MKKASPEVLCKKRGSIPCLLVLSVILLVAGCTAGPGGRNAEPAKKGVPPSHEEFFKAVKRGDERAVASSLQAGFAIDAKEEDGRTALLIAAEQGSSGMVILLLERGADVNARDVDGYTALMYAAYKGDLEVAKLLLDHGANVHAQDRDGWTALRFARMQGKKQMTELLKERGTGKR